MMNINCSENCIYCNNGTCTLDNVSSFSNSINFQHNCAYFVKRKSNKKASQNI
ncbi:hydroxymyristoyl-ACP dehydratase [Clostridium liquoris]|uniref:hydroxymyristoyl-ACP dehydratase n=1 Tax=Clostridium liquoris TaxID=1289519 RepID=UPI000D0272ED|nr:hydroxymyristoyl-ACP dehydratase [Clostridium liquoris]